MRYVSGETPVPILVAKGRGDGANRILDAASAAHTPAATDEDLASALYQTTEIGVYVGEQHFDAIARAMMRAR